MENMSQKLEKIHAIIQEPSTYRALFRSACTETILHSLTELLDERNFNLALAAIKLLGWSGCRDAAYALLEKLGYEQISEAAISALIEIGGEAIIPLAHTFEQSKGIESKLLVVDCLREIGGQHTLQLFLKYLEESDEELLIYALLQAFASDPFISLILKDRDTDSPQYFDSVLKHGKYYLESSHPLIRAEAVYLWGQLLGTEVLDDILNATKDIDPTVRVKAIKQLEQFTTKHPELIQHLIVLLSDDHPSIRKHAAFALGKTTEPSVFPALLLILDDPNPTVRRAAVTGIGVYLCQNPQEQYRQQVIEKLTDVLENRCRRYEDGLLKIETCNTLQHIETEQSKELLLQLAHDVDFDVRKSAIFVLGSFKRFTESLSPVLQGFLHDPHWSVREAAVTALGLLEHHDAESALLHMLDDPDLTVRKSLLMALGRIGSTQAIPTLVEHLAHDDLDYAAYQGLSRLLPQHKEQIAAYRSHENPKVHLLLKHILEKE
jgi:HEAT repeat protein